MDSKRRSDSLRFLAQKKNFMLCAVWCVRSEMKRELKKIVSRELYVSVCVLTLNEKLEKCAREGA